MFHGLLCPASARPFLLFCNFVFLFSPFSKTQIVVVAYLPTPYHILFAAVATVVVAVLFIVVTVVAAAVSDTSHPALVYST